MQIDSMIHSEPKKRWATLWVVLGVAAFVVIGAPNSYYLPLMLKIVEQVSISGQELSCSIF
jgi:hypothetical protein